MLRACRLSRAIRKGAMAFLRTEYVILFFFVIVLGAALTIFVDAEGWDEFLWIVQHDQLGALLAAVTALTLLGLLQLVYNVS